MKNLDFVVKQSMLRVVKKVKDNSMTEEEEEESENSVHIYIWCLQSLSFSNDHYYNNNLAIDICFEI